MQDAVSFPVVTTRIGAILLKQSARRGQEFMSSLDGSILEVELGIVW